MRKMQLKKALNWRSVNLLFTLRIRGRRRLAQAPCLRWEKKIAPGNGRPAPWRDPDDLVAQYNAACNYSLLGDIDAALDLLEQCLPKLGHEKVQWAKYDSDFDPVRSHPRYQKLFERIDKG